MLDYPCRRVQSRRAPCYDKQEYFPFEWLQLIINIDNIAPDAAVPGRMIIVCWNSYGKIYHGSEPYKWTFLEIKRHNLFLQTILWAMKTNIWFFRFQRFYIYNESVYSEWNIKYLILLNLKWLDDKFLYVYVMYYCCPITAILCILLYYCITDTSLEEDLWNIHRITVSCILILL